MRKAQVSMEYLMMVGVAFIILVPMMYIFYDYTTSTQEDVSLAKLQAIGENIVNTAEEVYFLGPPSRMTIHYTMPSNVYGMEVSGDVIVFYYNAPKDETGSKQVIIPSNNIQMRLDSGIVSTLISAGKKSLVIEAQPLDTISGVEPVLLHLPAS